MGTTYTGTDQAETFTLEDNDSAFGNGGNDRFRASRSYIGNVTIHGGDGNDTVDPFNWSSVVAYGDAGNDVLAGGYVSNYLDGGDGDDTFSMTKGQYTIVGGNGNDLITIDLPTVPPEIRIPEWDPQHLAILENSSIYGDAGIDSVNITADVNAKSAIVQGINFFDLTITYLTNKLVTLRLFDIESVKLNSVSVWSLDTSPPTVTTFAPLDEATRVAIDSNIVLTFNEAIQRGSGNILLKTAAGTTVATYDASGSANLSISGNTLTINPTSDLSNNTDYKVEFAAGTIKDLAGNSYAGTTGYNFKTGDAATQTVTGGTGNDLLTGSTSNDIIDGGAGTDAVVYSGIRSSFSLTKTNVGFTVTDKIGTAGADTLLNVERIKFSDGAIALDVGATQPAGQTVLLLGAVLPGRLVFDATKQAMLGAAIDLFDQGYSLQTLSGAVMRLPIWDILTGKATPTSTDIATYLLTNVNGAAPDTTTLANAIAALNTETSFATQGNFLWHLAESATNQTRIDLVGLATTGLVYGW